MKIVVIGGTGLIGTKVVANLRQWGHQVIAASPNTGVNTITGEGLAAAMKDTESGALAWAATRVRIARPGSRR